MKAKKDLAPFKSKRSSNLGQDQLANQQVLIAEARESRRSRDLAWSLLVLALADLFQYGWREFQLGGIIR